MSKHHPQPRAVPKYLSRYGEPEASDLETFPGEFLHGLVVPLYRESTFVWDRFRDFACDNPGTLLILVVNRPETDTQTDWAIPFCQHAKAAYWHSNRQCLSLVKLNNNDNKDVPGSSVLLVDRCLKGNALPKDQGVGLARKIGADILCKLISQQKVRSPWIFNTDADAFLPDDYFSAIPNDCAKNDCTKNDCTKTAAFVYPFTHCFLHASVERLPTQLYEFSLHYYVQGLTWAQSPYAYHTLGSTIAVNYLNYCQVRGFPKRAAAEDFYLLNKLAKTGVVTSLSEPTIRLTARESTRVPFGTGPAVLNLAAELNPTHMALYHPDSFCCLKMWLELLNTLSQQRLNIAQTIRVLSNNQSNQSVKPQYLLAGAQYFNLQAAVEHSYQHGKKQSTRLQHLHHWFDGFRTLKFIHFLRDHFLGSISFQRWLCQYSSGNNDPLYELVKQMSLPRGVSNNVINT